MRTNVWNWLGGLLLAGLVALVTAGQVKAASLIRDAETERLLNDMARPVLSSAEIDPDLVRILVLNDSTINAFATGSNYVLVNSGLFRASTDYRTLLSVLAHEIAHVAGGDVIRLTEQVGRVQGPATLLSAIALIAAGTGAGSIEAALGGFALTQQIAERTILQFTRSEEIAADAAAVTYLESNNIDPASMITVLEILQQTDLSSRNAKDSYASTHPLPRERLANIESEIADSPARGAPPDPMLAYRYARVRTKLLTFLARPQRFAEIAEAEPKTEFDWLASAIARHKRGDLSGAIAAVDGLIKTRPADPYYLELKGQILFESGKAKEALEPLRKAVELADDEPLIVTALAEALVALNDTAADEEARGLLKKVVEDDPVASRPRRILAVAEARSGNEDRAALLSAEVELLRGRPDRARSLARRAFQLAQEESATWHRARDLLLALGVR